MKRYNPSEIEPKWQEIWEKDQTYKANDASSKPKYYALSMFPYPSGVGLHIGHVRNFTITDVAARFMRMQGQEVLHPMGWDSFGLPGENYAIKTGQAPQATTKINTDNFRKQAKHLGLSIDWNREFSSSDPSYYKWTQWFFLLLFRRGLAYQKESAQFWCNECKTVLANEQVINGCCWRHEDLPVVKKSLKQWFFKITDYADRLEGGLEDLDWPEPIKAMQHNWIGRSKGAEVKFKIDDEALAPDERKITVFTTRPDTLFGATFMVLAPEHPLVGKIVTPEQKNVAEEYIRQTQTKTDIDRMDENREKTGVFTGAYAINPVNGNRIPVWIADYVLMGYGTGAIMAVPAHDDRDYAFAKKFDLPIIEVVEPETGEPLENAEFRRSIVAIVHNPKTDEFLSVNWGKLGGNLFVGGGLNENEDAQDTAKREIQEETGYTNLKLVAQTGRIHSHYFAYSKNVPRQIEVQSFLFDLVDDARVEPSLEDDEKDKFKVEWLPQTEIEQKVKEPLHALSYNLLVKGECYHGEGIMTDSGKYNGQSSSQAREEIVADLAAAGVGKEKINHRIRDWLISRQRYWGAPIPIIHCPHCGAVPVPDDQLPVVLPDLKDFHPTGDGRSPLAKASDWVNVKCPKCGSAAQRETDTMDGFACSSWYFLRFADPHDDQQAFTKKLADEWLPVDLYVGGAEHAVMHLLYARMWTKVMFDAGLINFDEPFKGLRNQGLLLAPDGTKFSKSKGNGVDPEDIINSGYGADALRTTMMFLAPFDQYTPWSPEGLGGVYRFLNRVWALSQEVLAINNANAGAENLEIRQAVHRAIKRVTSDMHDLGYNTAIAALMELTNQLYKLRADVPFDKHFKEWREAIEAIAKLLAPFAPHMAEELWQQFGGQGSVHKANWPTWDEKYLTAKTITIVVQVNGKVRARLEIDADAPQSEVESQALANENVTTYVGNHKPQVFYVPGRLINLVV